MKIERYDRSLEEVWEWKEQVYHELKDLSPAEYIAKITLDGKRLLDEQGITLRTVHREGMKVVK